MSTVKYRKNFFLKLDITITLGILTYGALHQIQLDLKTNALDVPSNLGGANHGHPRLMMTNTKDATLLNSP